MDQRETLQGEIVDPTEAEVRDRLSDNLGGLVWTFVLRGILAGALGVAALFWPTGSISLLIQLMGVLLILDGILTVFGFGRERSAGMVGLGAIAIGIALLIWPEGLARLTFFLLGAWALMVGIASLVAWRRMPATDPERSTARNAGFAAVAIGLVLAFWPGTGMVALGWAIAFGALSISVVMFWLAARFKLARERVAGRAVNE